ncbi:MAG: glycosyltransferase family A protein [Chitinophagaceae bacterium]
MVNYSIIIPHHNIPKLLERCLASIPQRDDLEIIIVDDNSDASKVDFEHFPGKERPDTIIIYSKDGKGGGHARNLGLEKANGKWVIFADADDFFNKEFSHILDQYKDEIKHDLIFFSANSVDTDTYQPADRAGYIQDYHTIYHRDPKRGELLFRYLFGEPWSKLVSKSLIDQHHIRFEETRINNDTQFAYLIGYFAKNILVDEREIYCVTFRNGSVSKSIDLDKIMTRVKVFAKANYFYQSHDIPMEWERLYWQLADLRLNDKSLYRQAIQLCLDQGLEKKAVNKKVLKAIPKALGRKYIRGKELLG